MDDILVINSDELPSEPQGPINSLATLDQPVPKSERILNYIESNPNKSRTLIVNGDSVLYYEGLEYGAMFEIANGFIDIRRVPPIPHLYTSRVVINVPGRVEPMVIDNAKVLTAHGHYGQVSNPSLSLEERSRAFLKGTAQNQWQFGDETPVKDFVEAYNKENPTDPINVLYVCYGPTTSISNDIVPGVIHAINSDVTGDIKILPNGDIITEISLVNDQAGIWQGINT